ncbi:MAG: metallophosphoesterase [Deltaproteobacteria bacterium]|nr:metallophosphoesterase [Deltaproteobacteria bacterium]
MSHTFVVSDLHLSDAQELDPDRPLWKRFKGRDLFIDESFCRFLDHIDELAGDEEAELILNGDVFDYDSVTKLPENPEFTIWWLERARGLAPEEQKSLFKMQVILRDHETFVAGLQKWVLAGRRLIFVIGNHDIELHWPKVQQAIRDALEIPDELQEQIVFCEWFYVSGGDTLVEHGNQYDSYCVCPNPIHPTIHVRGVDRMRLPFGNIAGKFMLNGMGLFNPHVESSFIKSLSEYVVFFVRYQLRIQPLLAWSWFWTAMFTLWTTVTEGFLPALRDPFTMEDRVDEVARKSKSTPRVVRGLQALRVHPAHFSPLKLARELWLDRAILLGLLMLGTFQLFSFLNVFVNLSLWWWVLFFVVALPPFIFYARGVNSDVTNYQRQLKARLPQTAKLAGVKRLVLGHTHRERQVVEDELEVLNTGTWSPAYRDVECTIPFGRKCFAWLRPHPTKQGERVAELHEWLDAEGTAQLYGEPARRMAALPPAREGAAESAA